MGVYIGALIVIAIGIGLMALNYHVMKQVPEGPDNMVEYAEIIRNGARTFLKAEYRVIIITVVVLAALLSLFVERFSSITFILGACMSSLACFLGMTSATYANVRTTNKARRSKDIGRTVNVALLGGSVSGLSVQSFGLLGIVIILMSMGEITTENTGSGIIPLLKCNPSIIRLTTYSLGCSVVAMFNRVAGGNYTKAADIACDIVAKIRHAFTVIVSKIKSLVEDDARNPGTVADAVGDIVNDIAGNCSDLLESFVATIVACILIVMSISTNDAAFFKAAITFPVLLASIGLFGCIIGLFYGTKHEAGKEPSEHLDAITYISAAATITGSALAARFFFSEIELPSSFIFGWFSPMISTALGIVAGVLIGKITEFYTSTKYQPVKNLAEISVEGEAFVVTKGDAIGSRSCILPIVTIGIALFASGKICGAYGIAISALGMLSFVATTVSIDAFGPIADNAGGIAEACHLDPEVREITDQLDAVGNTTAAIGKGFAIGSAAFATVSLIFAYVSSYNHVAEPVLNIASFIVVAGALIGGALVEYFSALLTDNTIESAHLMADEIENQLKTPGVLEGTVRPDYNRCIQMASEQALKKMLIPSILAIVLPVIGGFLFGVEFVGGALIGATIVAVPRAIFMGNSGGAFDNAKKYVESGKLEGYGKGSNAHKATVVGDTVGDTRKDVVGVALDIFIKTMSTVANTLGPIFSSFHLF